MKLILKRIFCILISLNVYAFDTILNGNNPMAIDINNHIKKFNAIINGYGFKYGWGKLIVWGRKEVIHTGKDFYKKYTIKIKQ